MKTNLKLYFKMIVLMEVILTFLLDLSIIFLTNACCLKRCYDAKIALRFMMTH